MEETKEFIQQSKPYFFIPNIVEYFRLVLLIIMFCCPFKAAIFSFCAILCAHLDVVDGFLARHFKQESRFGTILDYAIDRISIALLLSVINLLYPNYWYFFTWVLLLDIASHFCQLYLTVFLKSHSHKAVSNQQGKLISIYYTNRVFLYYVCLSHDLWLGSFYLHYYYSSSWIVNFLMITLFPGFVIKVIVHAMQIFTCLRLVGDSHTQGT